MSVIEGKGKDKAQREQTRWNPKRAHPSGEFVIVT